MYSIWEIIQKIFLRIIQEVIQKLFMKIIKNSSENKTSESRTTLIEYSWTSLKFPWQTFKFCILHGVYCMTPSKKLPSIMVSSIYKTSIRSGKQNHILRSISILLPPNCLWSNFTANYASSSLQFTALPTTNSTRNHNRNNKRPSLCSDGEPGVGPAALPQSSSKVVP